MQNDFIEKVKLESNYRKFVKTDIIYQLINIFNGNYKKQHYPKKIKNTLEVALEFYKYYNNQYYNMILEAIHNNKIIISDNNKSFVDTQSNKAFIKLFGNDADIFVLVHEFAHFIDINCNPHIIPGEYDFLCEVFSFYMEKQLELWLNDEKYNELIQARKNNRLYFESKMLNAIEYMLHCETTYKITGQLKLTDLDNEKVQTIMN